MEAHLAVIVVQLGEATMAYATKVHDLMGTSTHFPSMLFHNFDFTWQVILKPSQAQLHPFSSHTCITSYSLTSPSFSTNGNNLGVRQKG